MSSSQTASRHQAGSGFQPYIGLRPFTEQEKDRFFGRSNETSILLDKIRANRLTLLLAASGVGKSSLLQAGIMPELRTDSNIELIYYNVWSASPQAFKQAVSEHYGEPYKDVSLKSILRACTLFSSSQLVLLLDQFEELFNYHRFKPEFQPFIEELSAAVLDRSLPVSFVFSMREDFALELNSFKESLPGMFDNYFRLEKLTCDQAREAIEKPLEGTGYCFAPKTENQGALLELVLHDLAKREQERQFGVQELLELKELPLLVEPPHLQIVCQELWQHHKDKQAKQITHAAYDKAGRTAGILNSYFLGKIKLFSRKEQSLASAAFDHLIGQRSTKISHSLARLAELTGSDERDLQLVLEKLQRDAILRRQKRGEEFWYELYHDIFSESIDSWNREFKNRQRIRRIAFRTIIVLFIGIFFGVGNNWRANYYGRYAQLSPKSAFSDQIEVYQGTLSGWDIFHQQKFLYETPFLRKNIEADKLFNQLAVAENTHAEQELISRLSSSERFSGHMKDGLYQNGYAFADCILARSNQDDLVTLSEKFFVIRSRNIIPKAIDLLRQVGDEQQLQVVSALRAEEAIPEIRKCLRNDNDRAQDAAVKALAALHDKELPDQLRYFLTRVNSFYQWRIQNTFSLFRADKLSSEIKILLTNDKESVKTAAVNALAALRANEAIPDIKKLLTIRDVSVQAAAVKALAELGDNDAIPDIRVFLKNNDSLLGDPLIQAAAIRSLAKLRDNKSIPEIRLFIKDRNEEVRGAAIRALVELHDIESIFEVRKIVNSRGYVKYIAIEALSKAGDKEAIPDIRAAINNILYPWVLSGIFKALAILNDKESIPVLRTYLKKDRSAIFALGVLNDKESISELKNILYDDKASPDVQQTAIEALAMLHDYNSSSVIRGFLGNQDADVRAAALKALAMLRDNDAIPEIRRHLDDGDADTQVAAIQTLGALYDSNAAPEFRRLLTGWNVKAQMAAVKALGILRDSSVISEISTRLADRNPEMQFAAAQALARIGVSSPQLKAWQQQRFNEVEKKMALAYSHERIEAARSLANLFTPQAVELLGRLVQDSDQTVVAAAIESIGIIGEYQPSLVLAQTDKLLELTTHSDSDLREKAIITLGRLISFRGKEQDFLELEHKVHAALLGILNDLKQDQFTRFAAVDALGITNRPEYAEDIFHLLNKTEEGSLRWRCLHWLGHMRYTSAQDYVENELHKLENAKAEWREQRDQNSDMIADKSDDYWQHQEYYLGSALARIASAERGIQLLNHPLYHVRQGAIRALAAKADATLIGKIIQAHQNFDPNDLPSPFPYAAFRAIDLALWNLEYTGEKDDVSKLKDILKNLKPCQVPGQEEAIKERLEWTIDRLDENLTKNAEMAAAE